MGIILINAWAIIKINAVHIYVSFCGNSLDPDQLDSQKSVDQNPQYFPLCLLIHANNWNSQFGSLVHKNIQRCMV